MKNIVLIDFENLQVSNLDQLYDLDFDIYVLIGPLQNKISTDLATSAHKFGKRLDYIIVSRQGNNALDFHIAYLLGALSQKNPESYFHIISHDTGFDALIDYMRSKKLHIDRVETIDNIPGLKKEKAAKSNPVELVIKNLKNSSKPRNINKLKSSIKGWLPSADAKLLNAIVEKMKKQGMLSVDNNGHITKLQLE